MLRYVEAARLACLTSHAWLCTLQTRPTPRSSMRVASQASTPPTSAPSLPGRKLIMGSTRQSFSRSCKPMSTLISCQHMSARLWAPRLPMPLTRWADVAAMFNAWVHVDAAYAGSACICPEFRHHLDGVERVDSISMSPHKWLLTCLDCTCLYVRDAHRLSDSLETNPEYLKNDATESGEVTNLKDMQVGVGRRFRGLKLWMVMRTYGTAKLQEHIRSDVAMAKMFEDFVRADDRFEVVVPRNFALVCFRIKASGAMTEKDADEANRVLMENLNKTGKAYLAHTVVGDKFVLRFAVGSSLQEERHVRSAWDLIKKTTSSIMD
ncbi:hypothetical protein ACQJBY_018488 [Aegilops geniculata]